MNTPSTPAAKAISTASDTASLVAVDRAAAEMRRAKPVLIIASDEDPQAENQLILSAEQCDGASLAQLVALAGAPASLAITGRRAFVLGFAEASADVVLLAPKSGEPFDSEAVARIADPCAQGALPGLAEALSVTAAASSNSAAAAGVKLAKIARLLPAVAAATLAAADPRAWATAHDILVVSVDDIRAYAPKAARALALVSEARVPLIGAENTKVLAFRPDDGGIEHLALLIGSPAPDQPVLTRLHSECFTGDLLGSLRCDCGDQLRGAIEEIGRAGSGILLYLAQEGRGIGLVNKLRAYRLQDEGFDTLEANEQLGFDDDERIYLPAAEMLKRLGFSRVRLLTNNPAKVRALARHGITVVERVPHVFPANAHNDSYLRTKATRGGHLF